MTKFLKIFSFLFLLTAQKVVANTSKSPNLPLTHCYHWLAEKSRKYLSFKYEHALKNKNELTFYTNAYSTNGAVAGPGLYCAKAPSGSYKYGDRVIKIEFVRDVVVLDDSSGLQHCGLDGKFYSNQQECQQKPWDVKLYDRGSGWYLIRNPMAIARWSANSPQLIQDLQNDAQVSGEYFRSHANDTISMIQEEVGKIQSRIYINGNARVDILKTIRENPELLNSIPALQVLSEIMATQPGDLEENLKLKHIRYSISRIVLDPQIEYSDVIPFLQNSQVSTEFFKIAKQLIHEPASSKPVNSEVLFMLYYDHEQKLSLTPQAVSELLEKVITSPVSLKRLLNPNVKLNDSVISQIKKKIEAGFSKTQNSEALLAQRKFVLTKFSDESLAEQIKKNLSQRLSSLTASDDFRLVVGKENYLASRKLDQLLIQCRVYASLALEGQQSLNVSIEMPKRDFRFQLGTLNASDNPDTFCQSKQANLKLLTEALESKSDAKKFFVSGKIETTPYFFVFEFFEDIEPQLTSFFKSQPTIGRMDEIFYSINGSAESRHYDSDNYWKQPQVIDAFKLILSKAGMTSKSLYEVQQKLLKNKSKSNRNLKVSIAGMVLDFYVESLEDLESQCDQILPHLNNDRIDRVRITQTDPDKAEKDLEYFENYNKDSYWRTPAEKCKAMREAATKLPQPVLTQMQLDILSKGADKEFKIEAKLQNTLMQFLVNDMEELTMQCEYLVEQLSMAKVETIILKINNEDLPKIYNEKSYWKTTREKCQQVKSSLVGRVSPKEFRKIEKIKSRYKHHLNVDLKSLKFNLYINNPEDLNYQCRILVSDLEQTPFERMTITGMGTESFSSYNSRSYWRGNDICKEVNRLVFEAKSQ